MSSIGWVDFSEEERQRTLGVLKLLDEPGSLDSLGIGRIRDAFSDLLFPGTSTIQTRARYFLIVPWIYREIESRSPRRNPGAEAERRERGLIEKFIAARGETGGDFDGLIGGSAGTEVRQLPSDIYWQGMHSWGIRKKQGLKRTFMAEVQLGRISGRPGPEQEQEAMLTSWWDRQLPAMPDDLLEQPTLSLTAEEAGYLRETIAVNLAGTLLAHLVRSDAPLPDSKLVWELTDPHLQDISPGMSETLNHARLFSLLIHGGHILYSLMLAEMKPDPGEEAARHREDFEAWQGEIDKNKAELRDWFGDEAARSRFWATVKTSNPAVPGTQEKKFVESWFELAIGTAGQRAGGPAGRELLTHRERDLKGRQRARLSNAAAREYWTGPEHVTPLDFRWGTVKRHLLDIHTALDSTVAQDA